MRQPEAVRGYSLSSTAMGEELVAKIRRKNSNGAPIELTQTPTIREQIQAFEALAKVAKEPTTIKAGEMVPEGDRFTIVLGELQNE